MYHVRNVTEDLYWAGANDHWLAPFEDAYPIPRGVTYNSHLLLNEKIVMFNTTDWSTRRQLVKNAQHVLKGCLLGYLVINHLEPDHAVPVDEILLRWPGVMLVSNEKAFMLMCQFGLHVDSHKIIEVSEGDTLSFGKHTVTFASASMVHWSEVMVTFDTTNGVLFSADAFDTFDTLDGKLLANEVNFDRDWLGDARRYLTNTVDKHGLHIQLLLKKAGGMLDRIRYICPLHGPMRCKDLMYFIQKYDIWSRYEPEERGILVVYVSMYGNTESAAQALAARLCDKGMTNVALYGVSSTNVSQLISETLKYNHLVLTSVICNLSIYPAMHDYLLGMKTLNVQKCTVATVENGSWACKPGDLMQKFLTEEMKDMAVLNERVSMASVLGEDKEVELDTLVDAILDSMNEKK